MTASNARRMSLVDMTWLHCRYPIEGEGEHTLFCAADVEVEGKPYCALCRARCWQGQPKKPTVKSR
jgi:hypothetical protein